MRIDVLTLLPDVVAAYFSSAMLGRAQERGILSLYAHDLRQYSSDKKHHKVDDTPYGGGAGMVMMVQPFDAAIREVRLKKGWFSRKEPKVRVVMTAASGVQFTQRDAERLASYDQVIFLCGRYEGIDYRVEEFLVDEVFSVGPYVVTGGELPSMMMADAIARNIPGVLGNAETLTEESHTTEGWVEYPHYTKPEIYRFASMPWRGVSEQEAGVPSVLLSGDHKRIAQWRNDEAKMRGNKVKKSYPQNLPQDGEKKDLTGF